MIEHIARFADYLAKGEGLGEGQRPGTLWVPKPHPSPKNQHEPKFFIISGQ